MSKQNGSEAAESKKRHISRARERVTKIFCFRFARLLWAEENVDTNCYARCTFIARLPCMETECECFFCLEKYKIQFRLVFFICFHPFLTNLFATWTECTIEMSGKSSHATNYEIQILKRKFSLGLADAVK